MLVACGDALPPPAERGAVLFREPFPGGNSFACGTCHAESEPAADGFRRPGHPLADATRRTTFKNGALTDLRAAVNSCLTEWMSADALTAEDPNWIALHGYLEDLASSDAGEATPLAFEVTAPPADLDGGDVEAGHALFNDSCAVCHGKDATGTPRGPSLVGSRLDAATIAKRIRLSGSPTSGVYDGLTGGVMPFWALDRLSDAELRDLVAYALDIGSKTRDLDDDGPLEGGRFCQSSHPRVGQVATLSTFAHSVSGTAEIVDDCTIRIRDFTYDGGGIDVRVYAGVAGRYDPPVGFAISPNIKGLGFNGETLTVQLPEGTTLDDLDGISVWCTDVQVSFGDGLFQ